MRIYNQHVIERIEHNESAYIMKFFLGKCSAYVYECMRAKAKKLKHKEYNTVASFTGFLGANYEPMFDGLGRGR